MIERYIEEEKRLDGRKLQQYREIKIQNKVSKNAEGSARVCIGKTEIIAGVKLDLAEPFPDSPDEGMLIVTAELSPLASEKFEKGPPGIKAIELARIIDRSIRESDFINLKSLCIEEGKKVWAVYIDIYPLNDDGNLIDAAVLASVAALLDSVFPVLDEKMEKVEYGEHTEKKLPLQDFPITMTFYKIGKKFVLDPIFDEEEVSDARISIAITKNKVNALQCIGAFEKEEISSLLDSAEKKYKELYDVVEKWKNTRNMK